MSQFRTMVLTNRGRDLIARMIVGVTGVTFTKVALSATAYADTDIPALTAMSGVKQETAVTRVTKLDSARVKIEAAVENTRVAEGYNLNSIGLYAQDPDLGEILYSVAGAEVAGYVPAYDGVTLSGVCINVTATVSDADHVSVLVDPAASATVGQIVDLEERLNAITTPEQHANIFRGKSLGNTVTAEQYAAISAGTFDNLYVGDYWTIGNVNWRIADFDYWFGKGFDEICSTHHAVIVPDTGLYSAKMNDTDTTEYGYHRSKMRTENLEQAKQIITNAFGIAHILTKQAYFVSYVEDGIPVSTEGAQSTVDLMNEINVYGYRYYAPGNNGSATLVDNTFDYSQFALFRLAPKFISLGYNHTWWLRDVVSGSEFAAFGYFGYPASAAASSSLLVRPAFAICAQEG